MDKERSLEPNENEMTKAYNFVINANVELKGYIYATNDEQAEEYIKARNWEDIELDRIIEVEDIEELEEER